MVVWISHRGLVRDCSENSLQAFDQAVKAGFTWLETDLRSTADGVLVLSHDSCLSRIFGKELTIESSSYEQLEILKDPYKASLVRFSEFADRYKECGWVLDIKPESAETIIGFLSSGKYLEMIKPRLSRQTKFLFWNASLQDKFTHLLHEADCFARQDECWRAGLTALTGPMLFPLVAGLGGYVPGKTYALPPRVFGMDLYNERIFSRYHRKGSKILAYLPETASLSHRAVEAGADYVLSNSDFFNK